MKRVWCPCCSTRSLIYSKDNIIIPEVWGCDFCGALGIGGDWI